VTEAIFAVLYVSIMGLTRFHKTTFSSFSTQRWMLVVINVQPN